MGKGGLTSIRAKLKTTKPLPEDAFCDDCERPQAFHPAVLSRAELEGVSVDMYGPALCKCLQLKEGRERRLQHYAQLPMGCSFDNFNPRPQHPTVQLAIKAVQEWLCGYGPPILLLTGEKGSGKSHLAIAAGQWLLNDGDWIAYREEPRLFRQLRGNAGNWDQVELSIETLCWVPWLIYDDLGTVRGTDFVDETLDGLFHSRWMGAYNYNRRSLITTNVGPAQLPERTRDRLQDRDVARTVTIEAESYRTGAR